MNMSNVIVIDTETTGVSTSTDQIIDVCISVDGTMKEWRVRPAIAIPAAATAVHGITDSDVANCLPFSAVAAEIVALISAAPVVVGFNVRFDLDMLQAELARAGIQPLDLSSKHVVDVLRLWHHVEPRTLAAAHEKFCGAPFENAHAAGSDVPATARVLEAMLSKFSLAGLAWPELAAIANPFTGRENWVGPSGHIQWDGERVVFAFGKNKGCRVDEVDPGFLNWVIDKDFPRHVKHVCRAALKFSGEKLTAWVVANYPRPVQLAEAG